MWIRIPDIVGYMWLAIFIIWAISGFNVKRTAASGTDARARLSLGGVVLGWILLFNSDLRPGFLGERFIPFGPGAAYAGFVLTAMGLGFALWARFAIGRNWGRLVTVTEGHQLIRTGPYGIVRHPIYSGFMLATLGTAIIHGDPAGLVATALVVLCWAYKSRLEEHFMIQQFGAEYLDYQHHVKALVPGIW